jgi:hypothetical protein
MRRGVSRKMSNGVAMQNGGNDELDESVDVTRTVTQRGAEIHQLTERIHVKIEWEGICELTNVHGTLEIDKLKPEHNLRNISGRESGASELYERLVLCAPNEVTTEKSRLNPCSSRTTRHVEHRISLLGKPVDHISSHRRLPKVGVRKSLLKGVSVARVTSRVDIDLLIELGRLNEF